MWQVGRAMPQLLGCPCDLGGDLTLGMEFCPTQAVSRPPLPGFLGHGHVVRSGDHLPQSCNEGQLLTP